MKMSAVATPPMLCASGRGAVGVVPGAVVASGLSGRRPAAAPLFCLLLLLVFCLLYTPCIAAVASVKRELGNKWAVIMVVNQCAVAWLCALLVRLAAVVLF